MNALSRSMLLSEPATQSMRLEEPLIGSTQPMELAIQRSCVVLLSADLPEPSFPIQVNAGCGIAGRA